MGLTKVLAPWHKPIANRQPGEPFQASLSMRAKYLLPLLKYPFQQHIRVNRRELQSSLRRIPESYQLSVLVSGSPLNN